jgi:hypothetical protein
MKATVTFEIDTDQIGTYNDSYIVSLWHVAQANPADPFKDQAAGQLAEIIGREIIRRFITGTQPELWHHQGVHFDWGARHLPKDEVR